MRLAAPKMVSSSSHLRGYMDTMGNLLPLVLDWIWMSVSNGLGQSDAIANTRVLKDHGFCLVFLSDPLMETRHEK